MLRALRQLSQGENMDAVAWGLLAMCVEHAQDFQSCGVNLVGVVVNAVVEVNLHNAVCEHAPDAADVGMLLARFHGLGEGRPRSLIGCTGLKVLRTLEQCAGVVGRLGDRIAALLWYPYEVPFSGSELERDMQVLWLLNA